MKQNILRNLMLIVVLLTSSQAFAYDFKVDGFYYKILSKTDKTVEVSRGYNDSRYTGSITIPSEVTYNNITYIVESIGDEAFYYNMDLTSITIPNSVKSIGEHAFANCFGLTSIIIPNSVTSIGESAFYSCTGLTSITISNSVKIINKDVFYGCTNLIEVSLPNSVTTIGDSSFRGCNSLSHIILPNSVRTIGYQAFESCRNLVSIIIPNSVTTIKNEAFEDCSKLTSLYISKSVSKIGEYAFRGCKKLVEVICESETPLSINEWVFQYVSLSGATLYVPVGAKGNYANENIWKSFGNIIEDDFKTKPTTFVSSIVIDKSELTLKATETATLSVTIFPDTATIKDVIWSSSAESVASVKDGIVFAHNVGETTIKVTTTDGSNLSATCRVTVVAQSIAIDKTEIELRATETTTLSAIVLPETATIKDVVWSSTDATVASVKDGVVTAHKMGEAIIIATTTDGSNLSATCKVTVVATPAESVVISKPEKTTLIVGDEVQLTATVYPETATDKTVEWSSNDEKVAMVDTTGKVTAIGAGNAIITARNSNGDTDSVEFSVIPILIESLKLDKTAISAIVGDEIILTANIYPLNATNTELKWSVDDKNIASLVSNGNEATITILKEGTTKVFVETTDGSNLIAKCEINALSSVTEILNDEVNISVENGNVVIGGAEDAKVDVYSINGQCVYSGTATTIPVIAKGLYIVKVNGKSYKVIL